MKKMIFAAAAALICLTGCDSTGLVHDKNYLRAVAVDVGEELSVTLAFFSEQESVAVTGDSMEAVIEEAQLRTGRKIFTGYTELIVFSGERPAEMLGYMLKEWKISPSCVTAHSDNCGALLKDGSAEMLHGSVQEAARMKKAPASDVLKVLGELLDTGRAEVAELSPLGVTGVSVISD